MASLLASVFGWIETKEDPKKHIVVMEGIDVDYLKVIMLKYFSSKRIAEAMFIKARGKQLVFDSFFALELYLICSQIVVSQEEYKARRLAQKIIDSLKQDTWIKGMLAPEVKPVVDLRQMYSKILWKPDRHQVESVVRYGDILPRMGLKGYLLAAPPGTGKACPVDTKIKVPGGWRRIGDIKHGDFVTAWDGTDTMVIGVFPQGVTDLFKVTFEDGRSARVSGDHLWKFCSNSHDWMVAQTSELVSRLAEPGTVIYLPTAIPEPTEPLRGVQDPEEAGRELYLACSGRVDLKWLHASVDQRKAFIKGFTADLGECDYQVSPSVGSFMVEMIRSTGGTARVVPSETDPVLSCLTVMKRYTPYLRMTAIEQIEDGETVCLTVDHPESLFVIEDYIVTHNTFIDLCIAAAAIPASIAEIKIVISPINAIRLVWEREIKAAMKKAPNSWVSDIKGNPPVKGFEYYVFHYEAMDRAYWLTKQLERMGKKWIVIIDESHNFNTIGTNRTNLLVDICRRGQGPLSIWASGSPVKAVSSEVIPMLRSIDPRFTPDVEKRFLAMYRANRVQTNEILNRRLGLISFKIDKKVVTGIPPMTSLRRMITIPNPEPYILENIRAEMRLDIIKRAQKYRLLLPEYERKFYACLDAYEATVKTTKEVEALQTYREYLKRAKASRNGGMPDSEALAFLKEFERKVLLPKLPPHLAREFREVRSVVKTLMLKVRGESLGEFYVKRRAECATQLAIHGGLPELIDAGLGKTLIFSTYSSTLDAVTDYISSKGYNSIGVYGPTAKQVTPLVNEFMTNPDINPLQASYAALSTAVPVYIANQVVMLDVPPRQYVFDQTVARAARKRQENPCFSYEFILNTPGRENISTRGVEILDWSREQVSVIMGPEFGGPSPDEIITEMRNAAEPIDLKKPPPKAWGLFSWMGA